jgi:hypothetical protein
MTSPRLAGQPAAPVSADHSRDSSGRRQGFGIRGWVLVTLLVVGFGAGLLIMAFWPTEPDATSASGPVAQRMDLTTLGKKIGCQPTTTTTTADYQQAICTTSGQKPAQLTLTTFSSTEHQRSWFAEARDYGGGYLIGNQWIVSTNLAETLKPIARTIGGTLVDDNANHAHTAGK